MFAVMDLFKIPEAAFKTITVHNLKSALGSFTIVQSKNINFGIETYKINVHVVLTWHLIAMHIKNTHYFSCCVQNCLFLRE